ncbi:MAG: FtsK/SpoIIIE domain-containing protein [Actinomycetota bacterium]|nr:FtsK/SpoIIIE domain-containing protein [Actinomycetota bacterium]
MKLKVGVMDATGDVRDVAVVVEPGVRIGDIAGALAVRDPRAAGAADPATAAAAVTLAQWNGNALGPAIPPDMSLSEAGLRSGGVVTVVSAHQFERGSAGGPGIATLQIRSGPDAGKQIELPAGTSYIGRDPTSDVHLSDPMVSKHHAKIHVTSVIELVDTNSANGVMVDGGLVPRVLMAPATTALLGDTEISVVLHQTSSVTGDHGTAISFNRPPRPFPSYEGSTFEAPALPEVPDAQRIALIPMVVPVVMGIVLYLATKSILSIAFVGLTPLMLLGNVAESRVVRRHTARSEAERFDRQLEKLVSDLQSAGEKERASRNREHPQTAEALAAVNGLQPLLWARRPDGDGFLKVRLGLGALPSRNQVDLPRKLVPSDDCQRLLDVRDLFFAIPGVPVVADLRTTALGIAGESSRIRDLSRAVLLQLLALHSPAEVVVAAVASQASAEPWDWLKWTPHVTSPASPISVDHLAVGRNACLDLVAEIEEVVQARSGTRSGGEQTVIAPSIVLLVEDDVALDRSRLVQLAESGPRHGVSVVWCAPSMERLPAACKVFVEEDRSNGQLRMVSVEDASEIVLEQGEAVTHDACHWAARKLSPMVDAGARLDDASDLPSSTSFISLAGSDLATSPQAVLERWTETNSIVDRHPDAPRRRLKDKDLVLRSLIGQSATDNLYLDLRAHGPHALVGGTTGAGKSELLQSWIIGMATAYSPDRVTFLLIDYKGGSAFGECRELPHTVGMVTDLSLHLARRALTSLAAELRFREHILSQKRAKDLLELERSGDPDAPPSLVIVIDEFAALVQELPEFVDGVVNVAQRGRSLGLHLVLATQRPAGVIKDNLRANTNLRIALRMADEADSTDVLDTPVAASFDPAIPGRASAKLGPGRLVAFQAAYVGGRTADRPPRPEIAIEELTFGSSSSWDEPEEANPHGGNTVALAGPTDIARLVVNVQAAAEAGAIPSPRKPWLEELAPIYDLRHLTTRRDDAELVFGVCDDPDHQSQPPATFRPDSDGNMAIFGTGGSGKSTFLRSLAVAAGLSVRGGPCHIYALDFGARGLDALAGLPHVGAVIPGDDTELTVRLLRKLRSVVDDRAARFSAVRAGTIGEYRRLSDRTGEPRIFVLVDGIGAFRQAFDTGDANRSFDQFVSIVQDGRPVGVHVIVTADRVAALPSVLSSAMQQRVVLRMANESDLAVLGVARDGFDEHSPPGRAFRDGRELQVAVFGGSSNISDQAAALQRLGAAMRANGVSEAPAVERLRERVALDDLPSALNGLPVLGVREVDLAPATFQPKGAFLVAGPPGSGRTSALASVVRSICRWDPRARTALFGQLRSPLANAVEWTWTALGPDAIAAEARTLATLLGAEAEPGPVAILIEDLTELLNGPADAPIGELVRTALGQGCLVIADGDPGALGGMSSTLQLIKSSRYGIALQPEQSEGQAVFRTSFPRVNRGQFPVGRGLFVEGGKTGVVQMAIAD